MGPAFLEDGHRPLQVLPGLFSHSPALRQFSLEQVIPAEEEMHPILPMQAQGLIRPGLGLREVLGFLMNQDFRKVLGNPSGKAPVLIGGKGFRQVLRAIFGSPCTTRARTTATFKSVRQEGLNLSCPKNFKAWP